MSLQCYHELFVSQVEVLDKIRVTFTDESLLEYVAVQHGQLLPNEEDRA